MFKSKYLEKAMSVIMVVVFCLMAVPQLLVAAEPAYALSGTINSLNYIIEDEVA